MDSSSRKKKFQLLKKKITKKPVLKFPDFNQPFEVRCDASGIAIGDVVSQEDNPIAYFSENLNESNRNTLLTTKNFMR